MFAAFAHAYEFIARGGPVMVPIGVASIVCVALIFERWFALRRESILPTRLLAELHALFQERKLSEALALCRASEAPISRIFSAGLSKIGESKSKVEEALQSVGRREARGLERYLDFLAMLAAVSPLLGLLGTITGMINTFVVVRASGLGDPMKLSGGIAEALICTAAGLVVAIPAVVFHRFFMHKVDRYVLELEEEAEQVANLAS